MRVRDLQAMLAEQNPDDEVVLMIGQADASRIMMAKLDHDDRYCCEGEIEYDDEDGGTSIETCPHTSTTCGKDTVTDQLYEVGVRLAERLSAGQRSMFNRHDTHGRIVALVPTVDVSPETVYEVDLRRVEAWSAEQASASAMRSARYAVNGEARAIRVSLEKMRDRTTV